MVSEIDVKWLVVCVLIVAACVVGALAAGVTEPGHFFD
jgi:hypothetical protein